MTTLLKKAIEKLNLCITPPPDILVSEWADKHRVLSREASAEPGKWETARAPYFREPMDACKNPYYKRICVKSASQMGKTELLLNIISYYIHTDPSPILLLQPTVEMSEAFSKDRIAPLIRDTKILSDLMADSKSRDSSNTIRHKTFPGGHLSLIGANAPASLAMRPIRILLCDEINRYPASAGTEGNPVKLAEKRTTTFHNSLVVLVSTPTEKGASQISSEYEVSSKGEYSLLCPSCDHPNLITRKSLVINHDPVDIKAACENCGAIHKEIEWKSREGIYVHKDPDNNFRGFFINGYASLFNTWNEIEKEFLVAKDNPEDLKVFVNTVLAEEWEEQGDRVSPLSLIDRREHYDDPPERCLVLTMAVDTQDDRLEYEVCGWGQGFESWSLEYGVFRGDPGKKDVWNQLKSYFDNKTWKHASGHEMTIVAMTIDSGGHHTQEVYEFCDSMSPQRVWAIKGQAGWGRPLIKEGRTQIKRSKNKKFKIYNIAIDQAKLWIERRLKQSEPGEGYCHFNFKYNDEVYFEGLTSEKLTTSYVRSYPVKKWVLEKGKKNEPLDLRVYNYAAIRMLNPVFPAIKNNFKNKKLITSKKKRKRGTLSKGI